MRQYVLNVTLDSSFSDLVGRADSVLPKRSTYSQELHFSVPLYDGIVPSGDTSAALNLIGCRIRSALDGLMNIEAKRIYGESRPSE